MANVTPSAHASIVSVKDCDCATITIQLVGYPNNPADTYVVKLSRFSTNGSKLAPIEVASTYSFAAQTMTLVRTPAIIGASYWIEIFRNGVIFSNQSIIVCACDLDCGNPQILLTQDCPLVPVAAGGLLTYSGTVRNSGNVTLSNVVVLNNRSQAATITSASFVRLDATSQGNWKNVYGVDGYNIIGNAASYPSYANVTPAGKFDYTWSTSTNNIRALQKASSTDRVIATWYAPVSFSIRMNLTDGLKHRVALYAVDWDTTARTEKFDIIDTVTGVVLNSQTLSQFNGGTYLVWDLAGNITIRVTHLAGNNAVIMGLFFDPTPVFTIASLAPGASANFTGSFIAPADCSVTSFSTASGVTVCGAKVTHSLTETCTVSTTPAISIAEICPSSPILAGTTVFFGGLISNTGDVALTNIRVSSSEAGGNSVFGPFSLAPGGSTNFTGNYIASASNPKTNSSILTNIISVIVTNTTTIITTNSVVTVTNTGATMFGTINSLSSTSVDHFIVGSNFNGLAYAGEDHGYGATDFYSTRKTITGASFFDTITASTATTTDRFDASSRNFDSLAYAAPDLGYGPLLFYYLSHDNAGVSTFGSITPGGTVGVLSDHFVAGNKFDALTFAATDVGYGANLFYYVRHDSSGLSTFGTLNPALPGTMTDRFTIGTNVDALVFTDLIAPGYGANNFYFLRHDAAGLSTFGTILVTGLNTGTTTDRFQVGTNATELSFTATDVGFGPNLFYFLRAGSSGLQTNVVDTFTTNSVFTLVTNSITAYLTNNVISFTATNTITVTGFDVCQGRAVIAATQCTSSVVLPFVPITEVPGMAGGNFGFAFASEVGKYYTVQYKDSLSDVSWSTLQIVLGTGGNFVIVDPTTTQHAMRFYRVIPTP